MDRLVSAVKALCEWGAAHSDETGMECGYILNEVDWDAPLTPPRPHQLSFVPAWLPSACNLSGPEGSPVRTVANAILHHADELHWHSMYARYDHEPDMAAFRRSYGYIDVIGPNGPLNSDKIYCGISLQGADNLYPSHVHQAREVYVTIAGTGDWKRGSEPWVSRPPGDFFLHESGVRHATQSNSEPLLALAFWTSDLDSPVVIVRG